MVQGHQCYKPVLYCINFLIRSLHPPQLTSLLLDHTLSSSATSSAHDSSTLSLPVKVFAHLGHTHRHALRVCLVEKVKWLVGDHQVGGTGGEGPGEGRFLEMFALLQLFNNCRSLLDVVAEDILSCGKREILGKHLELW